MQEIYLNQNFIISNKSDIKTLLSIKYISNMLRDTHTLIIYLQKQRPFFKVVIFNADIIINFLFKHYQLKKHTIIKIYLSLSMYQKIGMENCYLFITLIILQLTFEFYPYYSANTKCFFFCFVGFIMPTTYHTSTWPRYQPNYST